MLGIRSAFRGIIAAVRTERNLRIQIFIGLIVILAAILFNISRLEWLLIVLHIGMVLAFECLNTFVEYLCDLIHPEYSNRIKYIKDVSAGAVLVAVISAIVSGLLIFYPYVWPLFESIF